MTHPTLAEATIEVVKSNWFFHTKVAPALREIASSRSGVKVGVTSAPARRKGEYLSEGYVDLLVIVEGLDGGEARDMERKAIEYLGALGAPCLNAPRSGGEGVTGPGPHSLYAAVL